MSCQLSNIDIDGLQGVYLENEYLKIGVLVDRGSDIFEFQYKPKAIDFLLRLPKGIRNPVTSFSQIRSTKNQFEDYYYGGWQICLPNSPAFNYRGAELGQHGEVSLIPWKMAILEVSKQRIILEFSTEPLRFPVRMERKMILEKGSSMLQLEERVTNLGNTAIDLMWGQHIAFGLPFLQEGVSIYTNAITLETEPLIKRSYRYKRNEIYNWPKVMDKDGNMTDASKISAFGTVQSSELCYLSGFEKSAYYAIRNEIRKVGFALKWDGNLFNSLWLWEERNANKDFPWWGQCYTVALEPWTSKWTNEPLKAIDNKEWLQIGAGACISTRLEAYAFEDEFNINTV